jgi:hypothetical protein
MVNTAMVAPIKSTLVVTSTMKNFLASSLT